MRTTVVKRSLLVGMTLSMGKKAAAPRSTQQDDAYYHSEKDTTSHDIVIHGRKQQDQHQHNDKCDAFFGGEQGYYCYP